MLKKAERAVFPTHKVNCRIKYIRNFNRNKEMNSVWHLPTSQLDNAESNTCRIKEKINIGNLSRLFPPSNSEYYENQ